ncbi:MAG: 2-oxoglutarate dehydrogenase complex dihydrolipoyllysine-residue succinyltransferase [Pseudomonadota bacterium]
MAGEDIIDVVVPEGGESVTEADIGEWMAKVGDQVSADDPIVSLETDKAAMDVAAPASGVVVEVFGAEGDTVPVGAVLAKIKVGASASANGAAPTASAPATSAPTAPAAASGGGEMVEVVVPEGGESVTEADIGEWMKNAGDAVSVDEPIVSLETDKAAMDVVSPVDGVIKEIRGGEGDTVAVGAVLAVIEKGASAAAAPAASSSAPTPTASAPSQPSSAQPLSPAPRKIVAENGLDPSGIAGTGKDGRVTKADALAAAAAPKVARALSPPRETGPREERVKMSRMRQAIARNLKEAQNTAAMLTTFNDVDMTAVMDLRKQYKELFEKKHGIKLGFMGLFVKACVHALKELPDVNAEIDGTDVIYKNYYDIGIAVGTDKGLVVPVVRDAETKSLADIESQIADFGRRARSGDLKIDEMQGGTFSITNGGVYGSLMSTPILNPPQSGILGMHRIEQRPVVVDGQVVPRPMMYLALSYDHRIVDGKGAVTFLVRVKENLEDPQRLLLDL